MRNIIMGSIQEVLIRDLSKLEAELKLYPDESSIWKTGKEIKNPAGNLCLHLCGNLQHYIGAVLGKTKYVRNREYEFAANGLSLPDLLKEINAAKVAVEQTLPNVTESQLESEYPVDVFGKPMTTLFFLVHLTAHFSYHLGQVNYHRRLLT